MREDFYDAYTTDGTKVASVQMFELHEGLDNAQTVAIVSERTSDARSADGTPAAPVEIDGTQWFKTTSASGSVMLRRFDSEGTHAILLIAAPAGGTDAVETYLRAWDSTPAAAQGLRKNVVGYEDKPNAVVQAWTTRTVSDLDDHTLAQLFATLFRSAETAKALGAGLAQEHGADGQPAVSVKVGELTWYRTAETGGTLKYETVDPGTNVYVELFGVDPKDQAEAEKFIAALETTN